MADPEFPRRAKRVLLADCMRRWRMDSGNAAVRLLADNWMLYLLDPPEKDKYPVQAVFLNYIHHFTKRQGMLGMFSTEESTQLLKAVEEESPSEEVYEARRITGHTKVRWYWRRFRVFVEKSSF